LVFQNQMPWPARGPLRISWPTSGPLLLRFADQQFLPLLFQLPPRITRFEPFGCHPPARGHPGHSTFDSGRV
jgi:hypothetical protein